MITRYLKKNICQVFAVPIFTYNIISKMFFILQSSVVYEFSSSYLSHLTRCFFGAVIVKSHVEPSRLIIVVFCNIFARFSTRWCFAQYTVCSNCHVCWIEGAFIWSDRYLSCLTNNTHALKVLYFIFIKGVKYWKYPPPWCHLEVDWLIEKIFYSFFSTINIRVWG